MANRGKISKRGHDRRMSRGKRRGTSYYSQNIRKRFLIVSEGEKTEPYYFDELKMHLKPDVLVVSKGAGKNTLTLIDDAIAKKKEMIRVGREPDEVWVMMDRDSFPADDFDNAIHRCESLGFESGWSNECFELWVILHFTNVTAGKGRSAIYKDLSKIFGFNYEKDGKSERLYSLIRQNGGDEAQAIRFANQLLEQAHPPFSRSNPCTRVQVLVETLNQYKA